MTVFSACKSTDCSGERCHSSPKRSLQYRAQNSQNKAYQGVLSPARALGLEEMSQPFTTSCRKPFWTSRSRWVRLLRSSERKTRLPPFCRSSSTAKDSASFCPGVAIMRTRILRQIQAFCAVRIQAYNAVQLQAYYAVYIQAYHVGAHSKR